MAEVFATAAAAAAALEQSIQLIARIRRAINRQKGLQNLIDKYSAELSQTKTMIGVVEEEEALRTPNVASTLVRLADINQALQAHLRVMGKSTKKSFLGGLFGQLFSGQRDQDRLDEIMGELGSVKQDLGMYIQLANVGLVRGVDNTVRVNTAAVEAVNRVLHERLGLGLRLTQALKWAHMFKERPKNADGTITLTSEDIVSLSEINEQEKAEEPNEPMTKETQPYSRNTGGAGTRLVIGNKALQQALQVNTAIGTDIWKDLGSITIKGNEASGTATQWNYPISSIEAFHTALQIQRGSHTPSSRVES